MTTRDAERASRRKVLVADDKFKRHFLKALSRDKESIRSIFRTQTEYGLERCMRFGSILVNSR